MVYRKIHFGRGLESSDWPEHVTLKYNRRPLGGLRKRHTIVTQILQAEKTCADLHTIPEW